MQFSDKAPEEIRYFGFNLAPQLGSGETIEAASFAIAVVTGTDPDVAEMLNGSAIISSNEAVHLIGAGVSGVTYKISATVQTAIEGRAGQTIKESALLKVQSI